MPGSISKLYHLRSRLKGLPRDTAWRFGMAQGIIKKATGSRILVYHGICSDNPLQFSTLFLTRQSFEAQLRFYKKYFNIVSLDDYYQQRFSNDKFNICLSFDDGFANNYKYVLPLLELYQVPATFFITAIREAGYDILWNDFLRIAGRYGPQKFSFKTYDFVKGPHDKYLFSPGGMHLIDVLRSSSFELKAEMMKALEPLVFFRESVHDDFWLQMTAEQIQKLSISKWVTIGSHGYYHNDLAKISLGAAKEEISGSKQWLETIISKEIKAIAFPYGSYTKEVVSAVKSVGFNQLLATEFHSPEDRSDATMRERLTINPFITTINQAHATITGNYK